MRLTRPAVLGSSCITRTLRFLRADAAAGRPLATLVRDSLDLQSVAGGLPISVVDSPGPEVPKRRRWKFRRLLLALAALYLAVAVWHVFKPLPEGIGVAGPLRATDDATLFADYTWVGASGARHSESEIFDEILRLVGQARRLIVLDMFLYNDFAGAGSQNHRPLSAQLTQALIDRKKAQPTIDVVVITDPFNTLYGGLPSPHFDALRAAGITVVITDLKPLRTPNPLWSAIWRMCCSWAGNRDDAGWLPSPVGTGKVTARSYLSLLNFNANHRKTLVVDAGDDWIGLVSSGNPHDASSAHGNVALRFAGTAALDLLETERAVIALSHADTRLPTPLPTDDRDAEAGGARIQVLTEGRIRDALIEALDSATAGDRVDIDVFYLAHRGLIAAIIDAHRRGIPLRVLLDPNEDAFGRKKNGIPNRQVAWELHRAGVPLRWCDTHGEQCHSKFLLKSTRDGPSEMILGSANYTRRNLDDYNLETSVRLVAAPDVAAVRDGSSYFERRWTNADGRIFSAPYERYADHSRRRYWRYRLMEATGLSTF